MQMEIENLGVVGAGQMGCGIVQVAAQNGLRVVMYDIHEKMLQRGLSVITESLNESIENAGKNKSEHRF